LTQVVDIKEKSIDRRFCVAPMMEWSDRHCRYLWRLLSKHAVLYTEMVTTGAIIHAGPERFLAYNREEQPVALQLGGSDPADLGRCATIAEQWGYDEVNLNCGCPSDRVQNGMIGACLMAHPQRVADCVRAMRDACDLPITVKHRIGIDEMESYDELVGFIQPIADAGCQTFIVHARKAWLKGLSPKQNREVPPLDYPMVYRLKKDFPNLEIIINGGVTSLEQSSEHLKHVDGVMLGRAAYQNPYLLAAVDQKIYGDNTAQKSRDQVLFGFVPYIENQLEQGVPLHHIVRHVLGLFQGVAGAKIFRRHISQNAHKSGADISVVDEALRLMQEEQHRQEQYRQDQCQQEPYLQGRQLQEQRQAENA
jgi:tRNA-dihydrouridine synthase A